MLRIYTLFLLLIPGLFAQSPTKPKTTHVLASLSVNPGITFDQIRKVMPAEIEDTVQLYLDGRIVQWFSRADGKGVVFLLQCSSVEEARATLDQLPLIRQKLASFEYTALGPLMPLRLLLSPSRP